ncbi:MAG: hypothetical protein LC670_06940 [Flavobacteriales bacterium]|nr:hypothetical protein [Flavobacteriales bacterium]
MEKEFQITESRHIECFSVLSKGFNSGRMERTEKCIEMLEIKNPIKMSSFSEASRYIFLATRPALYRMVARAKKTLDVTASDYLQNVDFKFFVTSSVFQSYLRAANQRDWDGLKNVSRCLEEKIPIEKSPPSVASRYIFLAARPALYRRAAGAKKTLDVTVPGGRGRRNNNTILKTTAPSGMPQPIK